MATAKIRASLIDSFKKLVEAQNIKGAKLGCKSVEYTISEKFTELCDDGQYQPFVRVTVDDVALKINGYSVIGKIEEIDGTNLVMGKGDMSKYRNISMSRCDHCNISRNRKHLVLLKDESANEIVVGSTCLKDFTGHASALSQLAHMEWMFNLQESCDEMLGTSGQPLYSVKRILEIGAMVIRNCGRYYSAAYAEENACVSTKDMVLSYLTTNTPSESGHPTASDIEKARVALEWYVTTEHTDSDFNHNVAALLDAEYIGMRRIGYILAILPMYQKSLDAAVVVPSQHIGEVGQKKVRVTVVVKNAINCGSFSYYGPASIMYIMKAGTDLVVYKTAALDLKDGIQYVLECTIKEHTEYMGQKQTVITRAKVISESVI